MLRSAGTHKDMKFKNTFDTPIYIEGKANGSTITFTIYGKKKDPKRTVEFYLRQRISKKVQKVQ